MPRRQTVRAVVELSGGQDVSVVPVEPRTESAKLGVRIGSTLIYIHDARTARVFGRLWSGLAGSARSLPRAVGPGRLSSMPGTTEPAVLVDVTGTSHCAAQVMRPPGEQTWVRVAMGRLEFRFRDRDAFASTARAFRDAADMADAVFLSSPAQLSAVEQAMERVRGPLSTFPVAQRQREPSAPRTDSARGVTPVQRRPAPGAERRR